MIKTELMPFKEDQKFFQVITAGDNPPRDRQDDENERELMNQSSKTVIITKENVNVQDIDNHADQFMNQPCIRKRTSEISTSLKQSQEMRFKEMCKDRQLIPSGPEVKRSRGWMVEWPEEWSEQQLLTKLQETSGFDKLRCIYANMSYRLVYLVFNEPQERTFLKRFGLYIYARNLLKCYSQKQQQIRLGRDFKVLHENASLIEKSRLQNRESRRKRVEKSVDGKQTSENIEVSSHKQDKILFWSDLVHKGKSFNWIINNQVNWEDPMEAKKYVEWVSMLHSFLFQRKNIPKELKISSPSPLCEDLQAEEKLKTKYIDFATKNTKMGLEDVITHVFNFEKERRRQENNLDLQRAPDELVQRSNLEDSQENAAQRHEENGEEILHDLGPAQQSEQNMIMIEDSNQEVYQCDEDERNSEKKSLRNEQNQEKPKIQQPEVIKESGDDLSAPIFQTLGKRLQPECLTKESETKKFVKTEKGERSFKGEEEEEEEILSKKPEKSPEDTQDENKILANCRCAYYQHRRYFNERIRVLRLLKKELEELEATLKEEQKNELYEAMEKGFNPVYYIYNFKTKEKSKELAKMQRTLKKKYFKNKVVLQIVYDYLVEKF
jgi:hypothetical protein